MDRHDRRHAFVLVGLLVFLTNHVLSIIRYSHAFHERSTSQRAGSIPSIRTSALLYPPAQPKSCKLYKFGPAIALLFLALEFNHAALIYVQ
jgi:hypothetical protein